MGRQVSLVVVEKPGLQMQRRSEFIYVFYGHFVTHRSRNINWPGGHVPDLRINCVLPSLNTVIKSLVVLPAGTF